MIRTQDEIYALARRKGALIHRPSSQYEEIVYLIPLPTVEECSPHTVKIVVRYKGNGAIVPGTAYWHMVGEEYEPGTDKKYFTPTKSRREIIAMISELPDKDYVR